MQNLWFFYMSHLPLSKMMKVVMWHGPRCVALSRDILLHNNITIHFFLLLVTWGCLRRFVPWFHAVTRWMMMRSSSLLMSYCSKEIKCSFNLKIILVSTFLICTFEKKNLTLMRSCREIPLTLISTKIEKHLRFIHKFIYIYYLIFPIDKICHCLLCQRVKRKNTCCRYWEVPVDALVFLNAI